MKTPIDFIEHHTAQLQTPGIEMSNMVVTGIGRLVILNGGSSAAEGGMGSGSKTETEKGEVKPQTGKSSDKPTDTETENTFDPVKEDIEKKESENKA